MTTSTNPTTTPNTDLINEMNRLQAEYALLKCKCCGKRLDSYAQSLHPRSTRAASTYATCRTPGCDRINITREINELATLTVAQIAEFKNVKVG